MKRKNNHKYTKKTACYVPVGTRGFEWKGWFYQPGSIIPYRDEEERIALSEKLMEQEVVDKDKTLTEEVRELRAEVGDLKDLVESVLRRLEQPLVPAYHPPPQWRPEAAPRVDWDPGRPYDSAGGAVQ